MEALIIRRKITSRGGRVPGLPVHINARAEPVAVAAGAAESDGQPMLVSTTIHQDNGMAAENGHRSIHPAVIVQISKRETTAGERRCDSRVRAFETAVMVQSKQWRLQIVQRMIDGFDI